ncbi:hypothetical protein GCM10022423_26970 [Flavobacterium ginsengiterrae]|uniref:WG repeat protein n=2 Tax=Flavobacterium ginsengiterrae TaxID=871695 RepID=A0ABP7GQ84_9FLAO
MKYLLILSFLLNLNNNYCQKTNKIETQQTKNDPMKTFDINLYKDWKLNPEYSMSNDANYCLMKGNDRVYIEIENKTIMVIKRNINSQYAYRYDYYAKTKTIQSFGTGFCNIKIGKWKYYNDIGDLIEEQDTDIPYKFSVSNLIEKFKNDFNIDIENPEIVFNLCRYEEKQFLNIPIYDIGINKYGTNDTDFYLIDGNTGKTLFCITLKEGDEISPLHEYQEKIRKQKEEDNAYFNTYKGKDYTKAEWEIFKEQHYKEYERKKESKGFWHDLFKKHDE